MPRVVVVVPVPVRLAFGAAHLLRGPVDDEVGRIEATLHTALPRHLAAGRTDEVDAMPIAGVDQQPSADIGAVDEVFGGQKPFGREGSMDRSRTPRLVHVGRRRIGVQDEVRGIRIAGFGEMDHVAGPVRAALGAEARLGLVGRLDPVITRTATAEFAELDHDAGSARPFCGKVLSCEVPRPHPSQDRQNRHGAYSGRRIGSLDGIEQQEPVGADLPRMGLALGLGVGSRVSSIRRP